MAGKPDPDQAPEYFAPVSGGEVHTADDVPKRRHGGVRPVHIVADGDTAFFRTWNVAGKAKRLRHAPAVQIVPLTFLAASRIADPGRGAPPRR
jgi:hypothetical protein